MKTQNLHIAINEIDASLLPMGNDVPEIIQLIPVGHIKGRDGRLFLLEDADAVIRQTVEFHKSTDVLIDYNHQSEYAADNGRPAPAAGWIKRFFVQDGVLCAAVEWTEKAKEQIKNKEFRYISPVFFHNNGVINCVVSAALTNQPNFELKALNQTQEIDMNKEDKALCQALAVPNEDEALTRVEELKAAEKALNEVVSELKCEKTSAAIIKAMNERQADPAQYVSMDKFTELSAKLSRLETERCQEKALNAVESAIKSGKLPPALKENAQSIYLKMGEVAFNEFVEKMPTVATYQAAPANPSAASDDLNDEEKAMCQAMGISHETFKKGK